MGLYLTSEPKKTCSFWSAMRNTVCPFASWDLFLFVLSGWDYIRASLAASWLAYVENTASFRIQLRTTIITVYYDCWCYHYYLYYYCCSIIIITTTTIVVIIIIIFLLSLFFLAFIEFSFLWCWPGHCKPVRRACFLHSTFIIIIVVDDGDCIFNCLFHDAYSCGHVNGLCD